MTNQLGQKMLAKERKEENTKRGDGDGKGLGRGVEQAREPRTRKDQGSNTRGIAGEGRRKENSHNHEATENTHERESS